MSHLPVFIPREDSPFPWGRRALRRRRSWRGNLLKTTTTSLFIVCTIILFQALRGEGYITDPNDDSDSIAIERYNDYSLWQVSLNYGSPSIGALIDIPVSRRIFEAPGEEQLVPSPNDQNAWGHTPSSLSWLSLIFPLLVATMDSLDHPSPELFCTRLPENKSEEQACLLYQGSQQTDVHGRRHLSPDPPQEDFSSKFARSMTSLFRSPWHYMHHMSNPPYRHSPIEQTVEVDFCLRSLGLGEFK
ncbi:hypothetical protein M422DRAFT_241640 [Sphaerobolus stellatus SS14]|nr:hypothetical protein M422DRAFT_241640 [Sphaerobolus stellatus SS14]